MYLYIIAMWLFIFVPTQIEHADLNMELDETKRVQFMLRKRQLQYAQQLGMLEVKHARMLTQLSGPKLW